MLRTGFIAAAVYLALSVIACHSRQPNSNSTVRPTFEVGSARDWPVIYQETAKLSWLYAQMAENSYMGAEQFVLPDSVQLRQASHDSLGTGFGFMVYEVKTHRPQERLAEVVIAFRGTDGLTDGPDWKYGNRSWHQNDLAEALYDSLKRAYPKGTRFVVAGHSLGGALALQVSTRNDSIDAFVFNSSYHIRNSLDADGDRYSIAEAGEIANLIRWPLRNPTLWHHPKFHCQRGGPFKRHGITALAWCVTSVAAFSDDGARKSLTRNSRIRQLVENRLLPDDVRQAPDSVPEPGTAVPSSWRPRRR